MHWIIGYAAMMAVVFYVLVWRHAKRYRYLEWTIGDTIAAALFSALWPITLLVDGVLFACEHAPKLPDGPVTRLHARIRKGKSA